MTSTEGSTILKPSSSQRHALLEAIRAGDAEATAGLRLSGTAISSNSPDWAEFIVRVPTAVSEGIEVYHYSRSVRCETRNRLISLP